MLPQKYKDWLKHSLLNVFVLAVALAGRALAQDIVLISEFGADNGGEILDADGDKSDWIELFNAGTNTADLAGWHLTDDPGAPKKCRNPDGTVLQGGHYIFFDESRFNPTPGSNNSFALSATGEDVYLFSASSTGELTDYSHGVEFGAAFNGVSFGRPINTAGGWRRGCLSAVE